MRLIAGPSEAVMAPDEGGGVVSLMSGGRAILSTGEGRSAGTPFAQGMNLLVPFSNRISRPFSFEGRTHAVAPNLDGEGLAIHGDGFQRSWQVTASGPDSLSLGLRGEIGPFIYDASVTYRLAADRLTTDLTVTNRADIALPYGGGFHPWFPRRPETRLEFGATGFWPEDVRHIPTTRDPVPVPPDLRFERSAALPDRFVNNGFSGWTGRCRIEEPDRLVTLTAPGLDTLLVYSPGAEAPFVCVEPVSHPVDAHNLPGQPGLRRLAPGESMTMTMTISWTDR